MEHQWSSRTDIPSALAEDLSNVEGNFIDITEVNRLLGMEQGIRDVEIVSTEAGNVTLNLGFIFQLERDVSFRTETTLVDNALNCLAHLFSPGVALRRRRSWDA
jgi:hypothetical protein